jgi:hypothetical protein
MEPASAPGGSAPLDEATPAATTARVQAQLRALAIAQVRLPHQDANTNIILNQ